MSFHTQRYWSCCCGTTPWWKKKQKTVHSLVYFYFIRMTLKTSQKKELNMTFQSSILLHICNSWWKHTFHLNCSCIFLTSSLSLMKTRLYCTITKDCLTRRKFVWKWRLSPRDLASNDFLMPWNKNVGHSSQIQRWGDLWD